MVFQIELEREHTWLMIWNAKAMSLSAWNMNFFPLSQFWALMHFSALPMVLPTSHSTDLQYNDHEFNAYGGDGDNHGHGVCAGDIYGSTIL